MPKKPHSDNWPTVRPTSPGWLTNLFFGALRAYVLIALYGLRPEIAGYTLTAAITYTGLTQAILRAVQIFGWQDLMKTVRSGDIASDLAKPFDYYSFWLAQDMGANVVHLIVRGIPIMLVYAVATPMVWPSDVNAALAFAFSLLLAMLVSFAWRFCVNITALWSADALGFARLGLHAGNVLLRLSGAGGLFPAVAQDRGSLDAVPGDDRNTGANLVGDSVRPGGFRGAGPASVLGRRDDAPGTIDVGSRNAQAGDSGGMMESPPAAIRLKPEITAYLRLYFRLISSRIRSQMQYRLSFLLDVVGNFFGNFTDLAALMVMFTQARSLGGWSFGEIAFLYGLSSVSFALHELFQGAFDNDVFAFYIQRGLFDQMLIRPLPTFFQMVTEYFLLRRFGRMTQGLLAFALGVALAQPHWTFAKLLYLPVVIAGGALFFLAISIAGCTLCFWTVQSTEVVNIFTYGGTTMLQYPLTIYQEWMQKFFVYILPMAFINYFPTLFFLDKT